MHFSCDVIDLMQSVESTLNVQEKSFTTVLDEVHFIVKLYSFPLPLVLQANLSFFKVRHLPLSQAERLPKLTHSFFVNPSFLRISQLQVRINKMVNRLDYHPRFSRLSSRILSYLYKLHRALSLSRILVEFSLKLLHSTLCGKNF